MLPLRTSLYIIIGLLLAEAIELRIYWANLLQILSARPERYALLGTPKRYRNSFSLIVLKPFRIGTLTEACGKAVLAEVVTAIGTLPPQFRHGWRKFWRDANCRVNKGVSQVTANSVSKTL